VDGEAQGGSGCSIRVSRVVNLLERKEVFKMKRVLVVIILVVLFFPVQATLALDGISTEKKSQTEFVYVDSGGGEMQVAPVQIKLSADRAKMEVDLNELITFRLECSPLINAPNSTILFYRIPSWVEVVSNDTVWTVNMEKGGKAVRELVVKPTQRRRFRIFGGFVFSEGKRGLAECRSLDFIVKGTPDPRIKMIKKAIEELKKELKEVEEGKVPKDTSGHPPGFRIVEPLFGAPKLTPSGVEVVPADTLIPDSLRAILDSLQQEYDSLSHELYRKKNPGIGIPLKLNESSPKGSYDLQAVGEGKVKRTQFLKS